MCANNGWLNAVSGVVSASTSPTVNYIVATSTTASSSFANGINLSSGCFSINGSCVGTSSGANLAAANTGTALQTFLSSITTNTISATTSVSRIVPSPSNGESRWSCLAYVP